MVKTKFDKIPDSYLSSPDTLERKVLEFWRRVKVFELSIEQRKNAPAFVFYEGPPTANGKPGIHHLFARTIKDAVTRYHSMRGKRVERKAGWDTHGLPVELEVEKKLGISGKRQIESLKGDPVTSIAEFNRLCRDSIFTYKKDWESLSDRIGFWLDYADPYITCSNEYIESVWYLLSRFFEKGLLYQGHKVLPYCTRCGTALSSHELGQPGGYRDVQDPSVFIRYKLASKDPQDEKTSFLVWTTTPWTLPSNVALAVSPKLTYAKIQHENELLILAENRAAALFPKAEVLERIPGEKLVGKKYLPHFPRAFAYFKLGGGGWKPTDEHVFSVRPGDFVSSEDGTGIVHMAPAYGADDYSVAQRDQLPVVAAVGPDGRMKEIWDGFPEGSFFKDADKQVMERLKQQNLLFRRDTVQHSYPFCWRCDTALMYFANPAWFLKTTSFKKELQELNRQIRWVPAEIGEGRFGEWLENNVDWALSRERYWGTPLPIWECEACPKRVCVESVAELKKMSRGPLPEDLHRPFIDTVTLRCPEKICGGVMRRATYVIDCWFDSGAMPYAQHHWPFAKGSREKLVDQFPADFIAEGLDQTRGWFYTLHAIATFLTAADTDRGLPLGRKAQPTPAYRTVAVNGLLLDKDGRKMSKRLGNVVDPWRAIEKDGVDAIRWYLLSSGAPHLPKRYDDTAITDTRRRVFGTLSNSLNFFALYANVDGYDPTGKHSRAKDRPEIDRWLLSRMNTLVRRSTELYDAVDLNGVAREVERFVDELSNWYIRRNRRRFWKSEDRLDKTMAYDTLYESLASVAKLIAPIAPFFAEMLWHRLGGEKATSVHLQDFPVAEISAIDTALEADMADVLTVVEMGRTVRERVTIRIRQPLALLHIHGVSINEDHVQLIAHELNVKQVIAQTGASDLFALKAKPNFPVLGKKAGKHMKALQKAIGDLATLEIMKLRSGESISVSVEGQDFQLVLEDVQILTQAPEKMAVESNGRISIAYDTTLTEDLKLEGLARELVNRIQNLRKDSGFEVTDRIKIEIDKAAPPAVLAAATRHRDYIIEETLAQGGLDFLPPDGDGWKEIDLGELGTARLRLQHR